MTSGFDEISLALFTALAPAGAVAFIVVAIARITATDHEEAVRLDRMVALPFSLCLVGFIASATHLGTPANALHVFSGVGRSPLSNEVFAAIAFLFFTGSYWMTAFKQRFPDAIAKPWLILASISAVMFVVFTSIAYSVDTVPTWNTLYTPLNLLFGALLAGPLCGLLFMRLARVQRRFGGFAIVLVSTIALIMGTVVLGMHQQSLALISNNEMNAATLAPHYLLAVALHFALGLASVVCAAFSLRYGPQGRRVLVLRIVACTLALFAVFITRVVFYQLHMTLGF